MHVSVMTNDCHPVLFRQIRVAKRIKIQDHAVPEVEPILRDLIMDEPNGQLTDHGTAADISMGSEDLSITLPIDDLAEGPSQGLTCDESVVSSIGGTSQDDFVR